MSLPISLLCKFQMPIGLRAKPITCRLCISQIVRKVLAIYLTLSHERVF